MELTFIAIGWQTERYQQEIQLRERLLRQPLGLSFTPEDLQAEQQSFHFGMIDQEHLVACLVVVPLTGGNAKVRQMCVDESCQRKGIGSALIRNTEERLREKGFQSVELHARDTAVGFYQRLGYEPIGDVFVEVTIPHQRMIKPLNPSP